MQKYDLIVIGAGTSGFSASIKANEIGSKTLLINDDRVGLGGTCVNVGCVPTKFMLNIAEMVSLKRRKKFSGLSVDVEFDLKKIVEEKDKLVESLRRENENVLETLEKVTFLKGEAKFISRNEILVGTEIYSGDKFIISTGSSSLIPPIKGISEVDFITSREALDLKEVPERILIIGSGAVGIEFAEIFNNFGSVVYLVDMKKRILPNLDKDISEFYLKILQDKGIEVFTGSKVKEIFKKDKVFVVRILVNGKIEEIEVEKVMIAAGRKPNTDSLGLENVDLRTGKNGEILVDEYLRSNDYIFAAGDVIGGYMLETVAAREGMIAANNALSCSGEFMKMDYSIVPQVIFSEPKIASVGLKEDEIIDKGINYEKRILNLDTLPKAKILKKESGMIKILVEKETEKILGIHIVSPNADEVIHSGVFTLKNKLKLNEVVNTLFVFPTFSEILKLACQSFSQGYK